MRNCFIPKCDNICKDSPRRMMFLAPKDTEMFEKWKKILPKKREFKRIDKVCERHFTKDDIMTTFDHVINGELLQMERGRPRLKRDAVPSLHLEIDPSLLDKPSIKRSSAPKNSTRRNLRKENKLPTEEKDEATVTSSSPVTQSTTKDDNDEMVANNSEKVTAVKFQIAQEVSLEQFESLYDDVFEVTLPSMLWGVHRDADRQFIAFTCFDISCMQSTKSVILNSNGLLKIVFNGKVVSEQTFTLELSPEFISNVLNEVDETRLCTRWRINKNCELLVAEESEFCQICS